ncbi:MAG: hypothetical protein NTW19_22190 [Planctomycetota bacterium]|nr:hypothetical protein [Planctomycetota bacterium]
MQRILLSAIVLLGLTLAACDQQSSTPAAKPAAPAPAVSAPAVAPTPSPTSIDAPAATMPSMSTPASDAGGSKGPPGTDVANASLSKEPSTIVVNTVCPVGGDPVDPNDPKLIKVVVDGKTYGMCCADCVAPFSANPAKYLSKK